MTNSRAAGKDTTSAVVLVVDDNPTTAEFLVLTLQPHYRTFSASSGEEAISFCISHSPDLVILDQHMTNMDGMLTCKMLRAIPSMEKCPIVFATGDNSNDIEEKCWDAGATDFIRKPFVIQSLLKRLHNHIKSKLTEDLIENMALVDQQSGLYNRAYFNKNYTKQLSLAKQNNAALSLIMFEIVNSPLYSKREPAKIMDHHFNSVAQIILGNIQKPTDVLTRYSENELALLLPDSYVFSGKQIIKNVMQSLAELKGNDESSGLQQIVVSASMASLNTLPKNVELIEQVLNILAEGKSSDRLNQQVYYVG